jgi:hypothetical protein
LTADEMNVSVDNFVPVCSSEGISKPSEHSSQLLKKKDFFSGALAKTGQGTQD